MEFPSRRTKYPHPGRAGAATFVIFLWENGIPSGHKEPGCPCAARGWEQPGSGTAPEEGWGRFLLAESSAVRKAEFGAIVISSAR